MKTCDSCTRQTRRPITYKSLNIILCPSCADSTFGLDSGGTETDTQLIEYILRTIGTKGGRQELKINL